MPKNLGALVVQLCRVVEIPNVPAFEATSIFSQEKEENLQSLLTPTCWVSASCTNAKQQVRYER